MASSSVDIWLDNVERLDSPNYSERTCSDMKLTAHVDLLVIHNISLPPAKTESDFNQEHVEAFFCNNLDVSRHTIFEELVDVQVSAHLYIRRDGSVVQFVPLNKVAWHAGISKFRGRTGCNDFSIGIEMQGTDILPYTESQYDALAVITKQIQTIFPNILSDNIVGHCHIAPQRKTDPGESFDWTRYRSGLLSNS